MSSRWFAGVGHSQGYWLPLTVGLRLDPSVMEAGLAYTDSCRQPRTLPLGDRLTPALKRDIGMVFEHVLADAQPLGSGVAAPADGVVEVVLGLKELNLHILRQTTRSYPATVTLGATVSYFDAGGTLLSTGNLRTEARGTIDTDGQSCEVHGLAELANDAIARLAQGLNQHLGTSIKILQAAEAKQRGGLPLVSRSPTEAGSGRSAAAVGPVRAEASKGRTIDVDQVPERVRGYERRKTVGIAIGVGAFRDPEVPTVRFASHDAEVMARYLRAVGGLPAWRVKVVTDDHALKDDLVEVLENWLPQHVEPGGDVLVFFSGRAIVDPATGAVSLFPHEGTPASPVRLFSLRRLQAALTRLPLQHAILLLDVTLSVPPDSARHKGQSPVWDAAASTTGAPRLVQIIGTSEAQDAHRYERGRHGLFTFHLLKGLGGEADVDGDGLVSLGELFDFVRTQVPKAARAEYGHEQEPMSVPPLAPTAQARGLPLARVK
ncbi:MAG: caspase family protein [Nitrospiraceae bacterium]